MVWMGSMAPSPRKRANGIRVRHLLPAVAVPELPYPRMNSVRPAQPELKDSAPLPNPVAITIPAPRSLFSPSNCQREDRPEEGLGSIALAVGKHPGGMRNFGPVRRALG